MGALSSATGAAIHHNSTAAANSQPPPPHPSKPGTSPGFLHRQFLGVGKKLPLLMRSWLFFSRPFNENFKFLKNCPYHFYKIRHSHSTHKGAPVCAITSKSYDWDLRKISKISIKMAKKQPFWTFLIFSKTLYDLNELLWSLPTPYKGLICAISSKSYDWDSNESEGKILIRFLRLICL